MRKKLISVFLIALLLIVCAYFAYSYQQYAAELASQIITPYNKSLLSDYNFLDKNNKSYIYTISASEYSHNHQQLVDNNVYPHETYVWDEESNISWELDCEEEGLYELVLDSYPLVELYENIEFSIYINGVIQHDSHANVLVPVKYHYQSYDFDNDRHGNQMHPEQSVYQVWSTDVLKDTTMTNDPLVFHLREGKNTIEIVKIRGELQVGNIYLSKAKDLLTYEQYRQSNPKEVTNTTTKIIEAEKIYYKNRNDISITSSNNPVIRPNHTTNRMLNMIDEKTFHHHGSRVAYFIDVEEAGYYQIGLKAFMKTKANTPVFIDVEINREIPFVEFSKVRLEYRASAHNYLFDQEVYLEAGIHEIAFVLNATDYNNQKAELESIISEINNLSMNIKKLTGNSQDTSRDWNMVEYLPTMVDDLNRWKTSLETMKEEMLDINDGKNTEITSSLEVAISQLDTIIQQPNTIPYRLSLLSQGSSSALQMLSKNLLTISSQNISIDQIIISGDDDILPITTSNIVYRAWQGGIRFLDSFTTEYHYPDAEDTITIWVRRPRQFVDIMQKLVDEEFTPQTGIKVNISILQEQGKLTLANAANAQPDGVLGIDSVYVNELAMRGSLTDLRQFGINDTLRQLAPGSLLQMIYDDKLYGIPETQDFYVLFYRKDILETLDIHPPETWDEVLEILPELQRYGMNFYTPLADSNALKSWPSTAPFFLQNNAEIYADDGMTTSLDSNEAIEAMKLMTDLFNIYGMPLQVGSFYNSFRFGELPLGVANFSTYIQLMYGAPEIANQWSIALLPGTRQEDNSITHWSTGGSTALAMFEASDKKESTWQFMEWWMSTSTQHNYVNKLQSVYGPEYLWNSANLEVLASMPIPQEHLAVIEDQVQWIQEIPRIPGGYYTERVVSDAWNKIIFNGENPRSAMDDAIIANNRELKRKMEEFGYIKDGVVVRPFAIPTIEQVEGWLSENE